MGLRVMTPRRRLRRSVFVLPPKLIVCTSNVTNTLVLPPALKLKVVQLYGYSSAFPHTRTRTAFPSVCTLFPVGHTVRPGLVWFNTYLPVYLSAPYTIYSPQCNFVFFLFFLFLFFRLS